MRLLRILLWPIAYNHVMPFRLPHDLMTQTTMNCKSLFRYWQLLLHIVACTMCWTATTHYTKWKIFTNYCLKSRKINVLYKIVFSTLYLAIVPITYNVELTSTCLQNKKNIICTCFLWTCLLFIYHNFCVSLIFVSVFFCIIIQCLHLFF